MLTRMARLLTRMARMARMLTRMTRWLAYYTYSFKTALNQIETIAIKKGILFPSRNP